jgi:uncharacterized protein with LGFP repeats
MTEVIGAIREKWLIRGGEAGFGAPLDIERPTFDSIGRAQPFNGGGAISWHPQIGTAFAVWGAIAGLWLSLGREQFGYPVTDEVPRPDGRGHANHFRAMHLLDQPEAWIYWTAQTGAHELHGLIGLTYRTIGSERSFLGYPTSDEHDTPGRPGGRRSDFEHGVIDWTPEDGATPRHNLDGDTVQNPVDD